MGQEMTGMIPFPVPWEIILRPAEGAMTVHEIFKILPETTAHPGTTRPLVAIVTGSHWEAGTLGVRLAVKGTCWEFWR